jgi:HlyD family secretion protein
MDTEELERERAILDAKVKEAESLVSEAEARIGEAEAKVDSLAADLDYAEYNEKRLRGLIERSSASEHEYKQGATIRRSLANRLKQAKASVAVAANALEARKATVAVTKSQLAELEGRINDATVRAPFDCTVLATFKDTGDWVTRVFPTDVLAISSNDFRLLMLTVPDRYYEGVKDIPSVKATLSDGSEVEANVLAVSNVLEDDSKGCLLRCLLPAALAELPAGLTLPVTVRVDRRENVIRVPNEAVRRIEERIFVYRLGANARLAVVPVGIELEGDAFTAISGTISEEDRVVVGNLEELGDGVSVEVAE